LITEKIVNPESVKKIKFSMMIWISVFCSILVSVLSFLIINQTNTILKTKVSDLEKELNTLACVTLNNHIKQVDSASEYLKVTTSDLNDSISGQDISFEEKEKKLHEVNLFLHNFSIIRNFEDMAIIYSDGYYAGSLSKNSYSPELLYSHMDSLLDGKLYSTIWSSGDFNNFDKLYFAKKVHNNAIFICSLNAEKLADYIPQPDAMNMTTYVLNEKNQIIYSSEKNYLGESIPENIINGFKEKHRIHIYNKSLVTMGNTSNNWMILTSAPIKEVLKERQSLITYVIIIGALALVFILVFSIIFSLKLTLPIEKLILHLNNQATKDRSTKFYKVDYFEERVTNKLAESGDSKMAIFYMDIDHFSTIVDVVGRGEIEKIIVDIADSIRRTFPKEAVFGRLSTDRFAVFTEISLTPDSPTSPTVYCENLQQDLFARFQEDFDVTLSIGISIYPDHGKTFPILYHMAERAMNTVKKTGRNNLLIFDPARDLNSWNK